MINKIAKECINKISNEINKPDNKKIINNEIILPLLSDFTNKLYPYFLFIFIVFTLNLILIIIILILIILYNKKNI
jgi:hypothetical protein